jgi:threonine/homoserine/homoserine lactone efflux protein
MLLMTFAVGVAIAFLTSIPVGPVGLLCISQSIARGKWSGFIAGLGASIVDVFFAIVAVYSLTGVSHFIRQYSLVFHIISLLALIGTAIYFLRNRAHIAHEHRRSVSHVGNFFIAAFLNITNPFAVFGFFTFFALAGFNHGLQGWHALAAVVGVFVGSCMWWYILCSMADRFESRMNDRTLAALNKAFGILILIFVAFVAIKSVISLFL